MENPPRDDIITTSERFDEIAKSAKEHRYINGKLSRGTRMDAGGV